MPKLYITSWEHMARDAVNTPTNIPQTPALSEEWVDVTVESRQSAPFDERVKFITVMSEVPCCLTFGEDPVAVVGYHPLNAGIYRDYGVRPGHKLAVIEYT